MQVETDSVLQLVDGVGLPLSLHCSISRSGEQWIIRLTQTAVIFINLQELGIRLRRAWRSSLDVNHPSPQQKRAMARVILAIGLARTAAPPRLSAIRTTYGDPAG